MVIAALLPRYKRAAAEGAVLELKLRLLAEKYPELRPYAHEHLENVELAIARHFGTHLSEQDQETLKLCRQLRNKLLHCDFRAARRKLEEAGASPGRADVRILRLEDQHPPAEQIMAAVQNVAAIPAVADSSSTSEGSVFGWFLEMAGAGDFERAATVFADACGIVDRLAGIEDPQVSRQAQST